jgi:hypothetical protein
VRIGTPPPYAGAVQPDAGGRFEALLITHDASGARFRVELSTSAGVWSSEASVAQASGEVEWGSWVTVRASATFDPPADPSADPPAAPPEWLCKYLRAGLRTAWRAQSEEGWPRRLTRWRDAPRPGRDADESR